MHNIYKVVFCGDDSPVDFNYCSSFELARAFDNRKFCLGKWGKSFYIHNYGGEINEELETFTDRQSVLLVINEIQNVTLEEAWEKVLQAAYK